MAQTKNYHHGDLKPALVQAARDILRDQGAGALSLRSIAAAIGVSHMAPYSHFKNKQELLRAVAAAGFDELSERMLAVQGERAKGRQLAVRYGAEYMRFALEHRELYRIMMGQLEPAGAGAPSEKKQNRNANADSDAGADAPDEIRASLRRPFLLLYGAFASGRLDKQTARARAIGAWSTVHGMAALIIDGHLAVPEGMDAVDLFKAAVGGRG
ncbi:MAG: TetR/AcrR family transcriptional regulator [bacterium]|nr:TetR/AcrR family transcriptional regulator [bacterium]